MSRTRKIWTESDETFLKENYGPMTAIEIGKILNLSRSSIQNKVNKMGLKGTPKGRFNKGFTPWNKNKKGLIFSPDTQFKKGHIPIHTQEIGTIKIRHHKRNNCDYIYLKITINKWVLYHRYIWEQINGQIPKGHNIQFRDGNTLNVNIDNLYIISRKEQIRNNSGNHLSDNYLAGIMSHKTPEIREFIKANRELIEIKRKLILLNREIKNVG